MTSVWADVPVEIAPGVMKRSGDCSIDDLSAASELHQLRGERSKAQAMNLLAGLPPMCDWPDPADGYCDESAVWVGPGMGLCDEHHRVGKQRAKERAAVKAKTKEMIQQLRGSTGDV
jgi:hypothetical protein